MNRFFIWSLVVLALVTVSGVYFFNYQKSTEPSEESKSAPEDEETPYIYNFDDFPVENVYEGEPVKVDFSTRPDAKMFITKIIEGAQAGPNFAGSYTVVDWGCGTACQMNAVVDAQTGEVVEYAFGSNLGLEYKLNSRLLIANPPFQFRGMAEAKPAGIFVEYYEFKDGELTLLARQEPGDSVALSCAQVITHAKNMFTEEVKSFSSPRTVPFGWEILAE